MYNMKNLIIGIIAGALLLFLLGWLFGLWAFDKKAPKVFESTSSSVGLSDEDIDSLAARLNEKLEINLPDCVNICEKPKKKRATGLIKKKEPVKKMACEDTAAYKQCLNDMRSDWDFACRKKKDGTEKISSEVSSKDNMYGNTRVEKKSVAITIDKNAEIDCSKPRDYYFNKCKEKVCK